MASLLIRKSLPYEEHEIRKLAISRIIFSSGSDVKFCNPLIAPLANKFLNDFCSICYEKYNKKNKIIKLNNCSHYFHKRC